MKNKLIVFLLIMLFLCTLFVACDTSEAMYSVTFDLNGGVGSAPILDAQKVGGTVNVPESVITKDGFNFLGWTYNDKLYVAGDTFIMPEENVTLVATWDPITPVYSVIFDINGGVGDAPVLADQEAGAKVIIPENSVTKEFYAFGGWRYNSIVYNEGDSFTMPAEAVTLTAIWNQLDATFSQAAYSYDRLGAGALELPLNLQGANLYIVEINDEALANVYFTYNSETKCLVIDEDYILSLPIGDYTIKAITDGDGEAAVCFLTIDNSVKTSFDEQITKDINVAKEAGVTFSVNFNGTTVSAIKYGDIVLSSDYYEVDENSITIKSELLKRCKNPTFTLILSNHDSYNFGVNNNILFYTDYDITTMHDKTISGSGANSLYQYATADSIQIVDGPKGMDGKVLKFVNNAEENTAQGGLYGLYTLRQSDWDTTWYNANYNQSKYYVVSFDYLTENTPDDCEFYFREYFVQWNYDLLSGEENDGVLHHFECVIKGDVARGTCIYANLKGGILYVDNFSVVEVDSVPTISANSDCTVGHDFTLDFDAKGWAYIVTLDGEVINPAVDADAKALTISAAMLKDLTGKHSVEIKTSVITISAEFSIVDNRVATLKDASVDYSYEKHQAVNVYGSFDSTLEIVSLTQKAKEYDNDWVGGWSFAHNNTTKNYKDYVELVGGLNNSGYISLSTDLLDMLWGTTEFEIEFSNGITRTFNIVVTDVLAYSDYDNTTIKGWLGGDTNRENTPLSDGFGGSATIANDGTGNNMLYINSAIGEPCYYNIRFCNHVWQWYNVLGDASHYYRVSFDYQISGFGENSVWFEVYALAEEDQDISFFGNYDKIELNGNFYKVIFYLDADGQKHTFDSGYFAWNESLRLARVVMPNFEAAEENYVAFDNFRVFSTEVEGTSLTVADSYSKDSSDPFTFSIGSQVVSVKLDGNSVNYTNSGNDYAIAADVINELDFGSHTLIVYTQKACYKATFRVIDSRISELTETAKNVSYGGGDVKLAGNFATSLIVTSVTRRGSDAAWDSSCIIAPTNLDNSYISIQADGITVSSTLINKLYGTTTITVSFDNGNSVSFDLTSNVRYFSDYDEVNVFVDLPGNSQVCQDRGMIEVVEVENNHMIKYTSANATLGHSAGAINGSDVHNFSFTVDNRNLASYNWYDWYPTEGSKLIIFFDYEVVLGDKTDSYYQFSYQDVSGVWHSTKLTGSGHFYIELNEREVCHFGINCPAPSTDAVEGTYLLFDSIGFGEISAE